ncbi:MAG: peptidoglycan-binding protein [Stigonema ocellatum SAG 48.90 = DSM 106950]|nr:peptidoglycan-binding protein [Stigonema ocellatum SAG 48.90 = DSM 106950]
MDSIAYFHLASTYEDCPPNKLVSLSSLLKNTAAPDWKRLSSKAWRYMLPLALTLSVLSVINNAMALERGDQGPSVRNLQQKLKTAGFYQAPITQVYDIRTEEAVRRFQSAAGLDDSGIAGPTTVQKLDNWRQTYAVSYYTRKPVLELTEISENRTPSTESSVTNNRRHSDFLKKGDEGEEVRNLQERLRVAGFYYGNSTGIYGPITEEAVKQFQQAYNLNVDGVVGPATQRKLPSAGLGYGEETPKQRTDGDKLRLGDRGEAVRVLQAQLIKARYLEGEPNGYYGPYTADAVRRFQAANYLTVSGVAGPTTRAKLYSLVNIASDKSEFDVLEIQRRLRERGFYKGPLNGVMGDQTKKAIKQAQEFYGISLSDVRSGRY